jgi:long-chain acyl-CoA synthetase
MGEIVSGERRLGSAELRRRAACAAAGLRELGVGPGDVIALYLRNDLPLFEASFAAGMLGAYPTPVNWHYAPDEADYLFRDSGAKVIVIHADLLDGVRSVLPADTPVLVVPTPAEIGRAYNLPPEVCGVPEGGKSWNDWVESFSPYQGAAASSPGAIIYTSGTTGRPKGVRRAPSTPEQAEATAESVAVFFGLSPAEANRIVSVMTGPMYHSAPSYYGLVCAQLGVQLHLQPRFDPEDLLRMIQQYQVTHLHMVPIMFNRLLALPEEVRRKYDLSSLEFVVHAAAPCPEPIKRAMIDWWGPVINEYYGSTETGAVVFCDSAQWLAHPGTVGKAMLGADVRVVDADGRTLQPGEVGEVLARWPQLADFTYHGDHEKRLAAERQGLIAPGDIGYLDEDGFLYLCDRAKDMIISGGANIYPAEIEAVLQRMPGVADCAVFGVPDDEYGEAIYAVVQPELEIELSEGDVKSFLRAQVASYKVPRHVAFQADLPREDSGKIFKRKLRDPFWANRNKRI